MGCLDLFDMWTYFVHMKTATVRDLRNSFSKLEAWLAEGEQICIEKRGKPIGVLSAWEPDSAPLQSKPDFAKRRAALWGDRIFSMEEVESMRQEELEGVES